MSRSARVRLIIIGLLIICCSLVILIASNWPSDTGSIYVTLEPTLFISP
ncbi:hypothetical protein ACFLXI_03850 [Chloroflexota bacterium]